MKTSQFLGSRFCFFRKEPFSLRSAGHSNAVAEPGCIAILVVEYSRASTTFAA